MLKSLRTKVSMVLLTGLLIIGIISTSINPQERYATLEDELILAHPRISHTATPEVVTIGNEDVTIDISNSGDGYLGVKYTGENEKVKLIVSKNSDEDVVYDIPADKYGEYVTLPFHAGSGEYEISVWESMGGTMFVSILEETESVQINDETSIFLFPSLNVEFDENSLAVQKASAIALSAVSERDFVNEVFNWVTSTIEYDYQLEDEIKAGRRYMTNIDDVVNSKKGICLDFATVMVAMLRSQGVPAKVVIGVVEYQGEILYPKHSWVSVYFKSDTGGEWIDYDPTFKTSEAEELASSMTVCDYEIEYWY